MKKLYLSKYVVLPLVTIIMNIFTAFQEAVLLTEFHNQYSEIFNSLTTNRKGTMWSPEDFSKIKFDIISLKKVMFAKFKIICETSI